MTREQFIESLLSEAKAKGIAEAEVVFYERESMEMQMRPAEIAQYSVNMTGGASLRGLVGGKMGASYTEAIDESAIGMLVSNVLESAELIEDEDEQFIFKGSENYQAVDTTGNTGTPEERIAFALEMERLGREIEPCVTELGDFTQLCATRVTERLVNTHGLSLTRTQDWCLAAVEAIARKGERTATAAAMEGGPSLAGLCAQRIAEKAAREAALRLTAAPISSGERAVILRNDAMASLLGIFSSIFSADAAQKGLSLLNGKEGETIAAPCVTLVDDPLRAGGVATRSFDAEGVATYTKHIVEAGRLETLLHNLKTAKKAGVRSTGNAARAGAFSPVSVSCSNFFFAPGEDDLPALEKKMKDGLVITEVEGLHSGADAISGDFSLLCRGYVVSGGARGQQVERVTVAGNFFQLLKEIEAVGSDLLFETGSVGSPSVLVKKLAIAGE